MEEGTERSDQAVPDFEAHQVPINTLHPNANPPSDKSIKAKVALVYPYSSSTQSAGLLAAEPDFRLRRKGGQVHISLKGAAALAISASQIGIGDTIWLSLEGASWGEDTDATKTPGRSVSAALSYNRKLNCKIAHGDANVVTISIDEPEAEQIASNITPPRTPTDYAAAPSSARPYPANQWASPAFFTRRNDREQPLLAPARYPFAENTEEFDSRPTKRTKFWRSSGEWTFSQQPPSPPGDKPTSSLAHELPLQEEDHVMTGLRESSENVDDENRSAVLHPEGEQEGSQSPMLSKEVEIQDVSKAVDHGEPGPTLDMFTSETLESKDALDPQQEKPPAIGIAVQKQIELESTDREILVPSMALTEELATDLSFANVALPSNFPSTLTELRTTQSSQAATATHPMDVSIQASENHRSGLDLGAVTITTPLPSTTPLHNEPQVLDTDPELNGSATHISDEVQSPDSVTKGTLALERINTSVGTPEGEKVMQQLATPPSPSLVPVDSALLPLISPFPGSTTDHGIATRPSNQTFFKQLHGLSSSVLDSGVAPPVEAFDTQLDTGQQLLPLAERDARNSSSPPHAGSPNLDPSPFYDKVVYTEMDEEADYDFGLDGAFISRAPRSKADIESQASRATFGTQDSNRAEELAQFKSYPERDGQSILEVEEPLRQKELLDKKPDTASTSGVESPPIEIDHEGVPIELLSEPEKATQRLTGNPPMTNAVLPTTVHVIDMTGSSPSPSRSDVSEYGLWHDQNDTQSPSYYGGANARIDNIPMQDHTMTDISSDDPAEAFSTAVLADDIDHNDMRASANIEPDLVELPSTSIVSESVLTGEAVLDGQSHNDTSGRDLVPSGSPGDRQKGTNPEASLSMPEMLTGQMPLDPNISVSLKSTETCTIEHPTSADSAMSESIRGVKTATHQNIYELPGVLQEKVVHFSEHHEVPEFMNAQYQASLVETFSPQDTDFHSAAFQLVPDDLQDNVSSSSRGQSPQVIDPQLLVAEVATFHNEAASLGLQASLGRPLIQEELPPHQSPFASLETLAESSSEVVLASVPHHDGLLSGNDEGLTPPNAATTAHVVPETQLMHLPKSSGPQPVSEEDYVHSSDMEVPVVSTTAARSVSEATSQIDAAPAGHATSANSVTWPFIRETPAAQVRSRRSSGQLDRVDDETMQDSIVLATVNNEHNHPTNGNTKRITRSQAQKDMLIAPEQPTELRQSTILRRTSKRLRKSDVPDVLSGWFESREETTPEAVEEAISDENVTHSAPVTKLPDKESNISLQCPKLPDEARVKVAGQKKDPDGQIEDEHDTQDNAAAVAAVEGLQTPLSFYHPLASLQEYLNNPSSIRESVIDVLAVVTWQSKKPQRAKAGPKDFYTILHVKEPSKHDTETEVHVFRPTKDCLPVAQKGDVILLRNFQIKSRKRECYLLSGDSSAWYVWHFTQAESDRKQDKRPAWAPSKDGVSAQPFEEARGAPLELGAEEQGHAKTLRTWWETMKS